MNVSAIIVTRGDVDLTPILSLLPEEWEVLIWDNGRKELLRLQDRNVLERHSLPVQDLSVYGRYAAIQYASHDLIYVQDDDVLVSRPQAIVDEWLTVERFNLAQHPGMPYADHVVCNMPQEFRHEFYRHHVLVGFGAVFHRDAPKKAFERAVIPMRPGDSGGPTILSSLVSPDFKRTCDIVFTGLTPRVLVDVAKEDLPWASAPGRMWTTPGHQEERARMLELVREARNG